MPFVSLHTLSSQKQTPTQGPPVFDTLPETLKRLKTRFGVASAIVFVAQDGKAATLHGGTDPALLDCTAALALCCGQQDQLWVIEDAPLPPSGAAKPAPVRFYAGAPLVAGVGGPSVGMLCLIDTQPKTFSAADRLLLRALAHAVSAMLLMPHNPALAVAVALHAEKSMLILNDAQTIEAVNPRFTQLTGFAADDVLCTTLSDLLCLGRTSSSTWLADVPAQGMARCHTKPGETAPVEVFVFALTGEGGKVVKTLLLLAPLLSGPVEDFLLSLRPSERNELLSQHIAGLWSVNHEGLIDKLSGAPVAHLNARDQSKLCGQRFDEIEVFAAPQTDWTAFYSSIARHSLLEEMECCVTHNGHAQWFSMMGFMRRDARGQAIGYHGSFRNITRRKLKENALRKAEERQRLILEGTSDGAWDWDIESGEYYLSPRWWAMMGRVPDSLPATAQTWSQFIHPDDQNAIQASFDAAVSQGGDSYQTEFRLLHQHGHYLPVLGRGRILRNDQGRAVRTSGTNQDLSRQHQAQAQIRLLQSCVESLQDVVIITHASPRQRPGPIIAYVNPAFERFTGYTSAEAIGNTPHMLQGPLTCRKTLDTIAAAMNDWQGLRCELANYKKSGELFWSELEIVPVKASGNDWFTHWIGVQRDITQRKTAELALHLTTQRLQMALDVAGLGLWTNDIARDEALCDAGWHAMLGEPASDVPTPVSDWLKRVHPDDQWLARDETAEGAATGATAGSTPFEKTFRMRHAQGHWVWIKSRGKVIERDTAGRPLVIAGTHMDVSAEVRARLQTDQRNAQLSRCLEHLNVGVILQGKGIIRFVNTTLLGMFGEAKAVDMVGARFSDYVLPGDAPAALWRQQQLMAGAALPSCWFNFVGRNGQVFKALTHSTVIEWDGAPHILSTMTPPGDAALLMQEVESVKTRYEGLLARQLEEKQIHIAHELHDSLGSQLACISLQAAGIGQTPQDMAQVQLDLERLQGNIKKAAETTRDLARGLMPIDDWPGSFWRALKRLCNEFDNSPALHCVFEMVGDFDDVKADVGTHLYRIAQEAIANALRHGHATHIVVRLEHNDEAGSQRILRIADDGIGFDVTAVQQHSGVGLGSIYARARAIGAQVDLARQKPQGFCVEVRLPGGALNTPFTP